MVDHNTEERNGLNFARLLVEVELGAQLPDEVRFKNEKGRLIEQPVQYDWKPSLCKFCTKYGHIEEECRLKKKIPRPGQIKKVDGVMKGLNKQKQPKVGDIQPRQMGVVIQQQSEDKEGSNKRERWQTPVRMGKTPGQNSPIVSANSFQILQKRNEYEGNKGNVGGQTIVRSGDG